MRRIALRKRWNISTAKCRMAALFRNWIKYA